MLNFRTSYKDTGNVPDAKYSRHLMPGGSTNMPIPYTIFRNNAYRFVALFQ